MNAETIRALIGFAFLALIAEPILRMIPPSCYGLALWGFGIGTLGSMLYVLFF